MELGNFNGQTLSGWSASTIIFVTPRNWNNNFLYYLLVIGIITLILMIVLAIIFCFWYKRKSGQKQNTKIESNDGNAISNIDDYSEGEVFSKNFETYFCLIGKLSMYLFLKLLIHCLRQAANQKPFTQKGKKYE